MISTLTDLMGVEDLHVAGNYVDVCSNSFIEPAERQSWSPHYLLPEGIFKPLVAKPNRLLRWPRGKWM